MNTFLFLQFFKGTWSLMLFCFIYSSNCPSFFCLLCFIGFHIIIVSYLLKQYCRKHNFGYFLHSYLYVTVDGSCSQEAELTKPDIAIPKINQAEIDHCSRLDAEHVHFETTSFHENDQSSERSASPTHFYKIFWNDG